MTFQVRGYAAHSSTSPLEPYQFHRRSVRDDDVVIEILYCGVCHSDLHSVRNDWRNAKYPIVPGHEIVGRAIRVGPKVTRFKIGDAVAVGCLVDSCRHCNPCQQGVEQFCENGRTDTYNSVDRHDGTRTQGGYSEKIVVSQDFVLKVPDSLNLAAAAPLLCAGITTYSPLRHWNVKQGSKVAIVGLGGLGHMGIKLAKAMGAEVTLFTRTAGKGDDARRLGADHIVLSTDAAQMAAASRTFDLIIDTVPYVHDVNLYIPTLANSATLVMVGYLGPLEPTLNTAALVLNRQAIAGSLIGGIAETQEMLDFCGKHNIVSDIELIRIDEINTAFERLLKSDVRYRFVIDMASLKNPA